MKNKQNIKSLLIYITCIILIIISLSLGIKKISNDNKKKGKEKNTEEKISYYKPEYKDRYNKYRKENKDLSNEQVIIDVNIGLDYNYYENSKPSKNLNKETILVNKYNYLQQDYIPNNLENISTEYARSGMSLVNYAKDAFEDLAKAAKKEGMSIIAMSSYRSYKYQYNLYNKYKAQDGEEVADTYSARPGYSEHQTGLAVDVYNGKESFTNFENTKEFDWMQKNAYKYGFILRFPKSKAKETGYDYESWHYRYVGISIAKYIHENDISFEEYYIKKIEK